MLESAVAGHDVALQVVALGSRFETFRTFRDALRASSSRLAAYNTMKRSCEGLDADTYRGIKSQFISELLSTIR